MMRDEEWTNQKFVNRLRNLIFWARYSDYITCHLGTRKIDFAIPFFLEFFDLVHACNEFSMVQAVDVDSLGDKLRVLYTAPVMSDITVKPACREKGWEDPHLLGNPQGY